MDSKITSSKHKTHTLSSKASPKNPIILNLYGRLLTPYSPWVLHNSRLTLVSLESHTLCHADPSSLILPH